MDSHQVFQGSLGRNANLLSAVARLSHTSWAPFGRKARAGESRTGPPAGWLAVSLLAAAIGVPGWILLSSTPAPRRVVAAAASGCPTPAAASRVNTALIAAERRYRTESRGKVIHADLRQIAGDPRLLTALSAGALSSALAEANRQLVRHVVQIVVSRGSRTLIDANPTSFDVAGSGVELRTRSGRALGQLRITVQDVIGFIKLIHKLDAADVVVRSAGGQMRTSLPAAAAIALPRSGCTRVAGRTYVVRSFEETGFSGEALTIRVLTAA